MERKDSKITIYLKLIFFFFFPQKFVRQVFLFLPGNYIFSNNTVVWKLFFCFSIFSLNHHVRRRGTSKAGESQLLPLLLISLFLPSYAILQYLFTVLVLLDTPLLNQYIMRIISVLSEV